MAKIKVTQGNIKSKINDWKNGIGVVNGVATDEYVFYPDDIDIKEIVLLAWDKELLIRVETESDFFKKFVYVEKIVK